MRTEEEDHEDDHLSRPHDRFFVRPLKIKKLCGRDIGGRYTIYLGVISHRVTDVIEDALIHDVPRGAQHAPVNFDQLIKLVVGRKQLSLDSLFQQIHIIQGHDPVGCIRGK